MATMTAPRKAQAVAPDKYIFPPRSTDAIPLAEAKIFATLGWVAQLKYNDGRTLIKYLPGSKVELWNRHGERFRTYQAPDWLQDQLIETHTKLGLDKNTWSLLDGGLLDQKHQAIKDTIVIWDILVQNGKHLLGSKYKDRYDFLKGNLTNGDPWYYQPPHKKHEPQDFGLKVHDNILLPRNHSGEQEWQDLWDGILTTVNTPYQIGKPGDKNYDLKPVIEGLVFKDPNGELERGFKEKNNSGWMIRSRVETGRHRF